MPRSPAAPPQLPGLTVIRHLGSGGFADVFLCRDELLGRAVAVKVLVADQLGASAKQAFTNEANLMAQLSNHPSVVSVYQAGIASDNRPYLVMEYCSGPNLDDRLRTGRFTEPEVTRLGIQIAGAVETVHRAGILHRDIKPANILVTEFGRPALTDFGIAASESVSAHNGLSIPWAPAEVLAGHPGDARSDVYSLAATLYTLLAGRSPFNLPGTRSTSQELAHRITAGALPPIGRPNVSTSLEAVLRKAMAREPNERYPSALAFGHALQRVQADQGFTPTPLDVAETPALFSSQEDLGHTQIRSASGRAVQASLPSATGPSSTPPPTGEAPVETTFLRTASPTREVVGTVRTEAARAGNARGLRVALLAAVGLIAGLGFVVLSLSATHWMQAGSAVAIPASPEPAIGAPSGTPAAPAAATSTPSEVIQSEQANADAPTGAPKPTESLATAPTERGETAAPLPFHCWNGNDVTASSRCPAPSTKAESYAYLRYVFPSIDDHGGCEKADSSAKYDGFTVMWDCDLGSGLLRYRFWQKAADATGYYSTKFPGGTFTSYDLSLSGTNENVPGWVKEANELVENKTTGTTSHSLTVWIPKYRLSISAEGDTKESLHEALQQARSVPFRNFHGWTGEDSPESQSFVLNRD
ncbi:MAG TPA: serine/threonine-protein kinase [Propionicimonas sp.]|nr:serine/threonine-protein kinase [Propionicimonas sp.]